MDRRIYTTTCVASDLPRVKAELKRYGDVFVSSSPVTVTDVMDRRVPGYMVSYRLAPEYAAAVGRAS